MTPDQDEAWHKMVELGQEIGDEPSPALVAEILEGMAEADRGETVDLGSFAQYADGDD